MGRKGNSHKRSTRHDKVSNLVVAYASIGQDSAFFLEQEALLRLSGVVYRRLGLIPQQIGLEKLQSRLSGALLQNSSSLRRPVRQAGLMMHKRLRCFS